MVQLFILFYDGNRNVLMDDKLKARGNSIDKAKDFFDN